jgi:lipid-binding SYLF domain-containing protein
MKKKLKIESIKHFMLIAALSISQLLIAQLTSKEKKLIQKGEDAKIEFIKTDPLLKTLFDKAYGYTIFPNVGKGAMVVGAAAGNGPTYEKGKLIGIASMTQVTIGFQTGGQAYREVIFFENKKALDRFKSNNIEFSAQASAIALTEGALANVKYVDGVMIFAQTKGGLMYEASLGGQQFKFKSL